jgi:hypothetical protein
VIEVAAELLVVPTSGNAKVFELALTLFTVEEEDALVLASIGVEEEDWLDGVVDNFF